MRLELAYALAREAKVAADLLERLRRTRQAVVTLEHEPLPIGKVGQRSADDGAAPVAVQLVVQVLGTGIGDQFSELDQVAALGADRLVERDRRPRAREHIVHGAW